MRLPGLAATLMLIAMALHGCAGVPKPLDFTCETTLEAEGVQARSRMSVDPVTGLLRTEGQLNDWTWWGVNYPQAPTATMAQYQTGPGGGGAGRITFAMLLRDRPRAKPARIELRAVGGGALSPSVGEATGRRRDTHYALSADVEALAPLIQSGRPHVLSLVAADGSVIEALPVDLDAVARGRALLERAIAETRAKAARFEAECGQEIIVA